MINGGGVGAIVEFFELAGGGFGGEEGAVGGGDEAAADGVSRIGFGRSEGGDKVKVYVRRLNH